MHTYGFFVSLPGTLLQRLLRRLQVLVQELTHDNARREGNEVFLSRYGFHEILCTILARRAIDAAPLPPARCLYPVTCLPSSVGPFTRSAPRRHLRSFWPRTTSFLLAVRLPVGVTVVVKPCIASFRLVVLPAKERFTEILVHPSI